jgi:hypothetical protein
MGLAPSTALVAVPSVTVALVGLALLLVGAPQPAVGARIYGGPTRGTEVLAWRIAARASEAGAEEPLRGAKLRVEAELPDGRVVSTSGTTDAEGLLDVELALGAKVAPLVARIQSEAPVPMPPLAQGTVDLAPQPWAQAARRRGGPSTQHRHDYSLTVAAGRAVLAVPFEDELELELRRGQTPIAAAVLEFSADGLELLSEQKSITDAAGRARLRVRPTFHQVTLQVRVKLPRGLPPQAPATEHAAEGMLQYWAFPLPVVPGALLGEASESADQLKLRVTSPIARERAYLSLVDEQQRFSGASVDLSPSAGGTATGELSLRKPSSSKLWLVVSSDADEDTQSTVGWPLWGVQPATTFDARLPLLLDGMPAARGREARRQRRAQYVAAAVAMTGLLTAAAFMLMLYRQSKAPVLDAMLAELEGPSQQRSAPTTLLWAIFGVFVVGCGFALLALFALYRG